MVEECFAYKVFHLVGLQMPYKVAAGVPRNFVVLVAELLHVVVADIRYSRGNCAVDAIHRLRLYRRNKRNLFAVGVFFNLFKQFFYVLFNHKMPSAQFFIFKPRAVRLFSALFKFVTAARWSAPRLSLLSSFIYIIFAKLYLH